MMEELYRDIVRDIEGYLANADMSALLAAMRANTPELAEVIEVVDRLQAELVTARKRLALLGLRPPVAA